MSPLALCCCLPCVNSSFVKSTVGIIKIAELILGYFCMHLISHYGSVYRISLGSTVDQFHTTCATCSYTTFTLFICYALSSNTLARETLFNALGALSYLSCSLYILIALYTYLYPVDKVASFFIYPVVELSYMVGLGLACIHTYDAYLSYCGSSASLPV